MLHAIRHAAVDDVTGDGHVDLVVSAYGEGTRVGGPLPEASGGGVYVLKGGKAGVATAGSRFYDHASPGMPTG